MRAKKCKRLLSVLMATAMVLSSTGTVGGGESKVRYSRSGRDSRGKRELQQGLEIQTW